MSPGVLSRVKAAALVTLWISLIGLLKARIDRAIIYMMCSICLRRMVTVTNEGVFHLRSISPHLPCPVRFLIKMAHSRRSSLKPGILEPWILD